MKERNSHWISSIAYRSAQMRVGSARIEGKGSYQGSNGLMRNLDRQMYRMEFDPFLSLDPFLPGFGCEPTGSFPFTFSILEAPRFFRRKEHVLFKTSFFFCTVCTFWTKVMFIQFIPRFFWSFSLLGIFRSVCFGFFHFGRCSDIQFLEEVLLKWFELWISWKTETFKSLFMWKRLTSSNSRN